MTNNLLTLMFLSFKRFCYEFSIRPEEFLGVGVPSWSHLLFLGLGQLLRMDQEYLSQRRKVEHGTSGEFCLPAGV